MANFLIKTPGKIMCGSITSVKAKCGTPTCKCHQDDKYLHGPYYRWTGKINGKRTTVTLSEKDALECQKRIKNYKTFQTQVEKIINKSLKDAPWIK